MKENLHQSIKAKCTQGCIDRSGNSRICTTLLWNFTFCGLQNIKNSRSHNHRGEESGLAAILALLVMCNRRHIVDKLCAKYTRPWILYAWSANCTEIPAYLLSCGVLYGRVSLWEAELKWWNKNDPSLLHPVNPYLTVTPEHEDSEH